MSAAAAAAALTPLQQQELLGLIQARNMGKLARLERGERRTETGRLHTAVEAWVIFLVIAVGLIVWIMSVERRLTARFQTVIKLLDNAADNGYEGPRGMSTCLAYQYGAVGSFLLGFQNKNLPIAILHAYYTASTNATFVGADNGLTSLRAMWHYCEVNPDAEAADIICKGLQMQNADLCKQTCNPSLMQTTNGQVAGYIGAASSGVATGVMAGAMASKLSSSAGGPIGAVVGAGLMALSMYQEFAAQKASSDQCNQLRKTCIFVDGSSC